VRIESVRFDASGNATIAASGGISFFVPAARVEELRDLVEGERDGWTGRNGGIERGRGFPARSAGLESLAERGPELDREDELYCLLAAIDEEFRAKKKALELCARAEQSSRGLEAKLAARGFSRRAVKAALESLRGEGILDDARYARIWARGRAERRAFGPALLAAELRSRGQGEDAVRLALGDIDFSGVLARAVVREYDRLGAAWRKKGLEIDGNFSDSLYRILRRQGFDPEMIREEIAKLLQSQGM